MKISLRHLSKDYKDADRVLTILHDVTFDFPEHATVGILGKSGIGKSTLLHLIGALDRPTSGSIFYDDFDISTAPNDVRSSFRGEHVGFIFQFHQLLPEFNAVENVAMPLIIAGRPDREATARATELLERVGLEHRLDHRPGQLSGGEQQRVAIARALAARPQVILADEPTGNLDVETAREVQDLLLAINKELKNTLIVVTHNTELAASLDLVLEMKPGGTLQPLRK